MAFGYALLKGRGGAAGYARESGGQREVSARNLRPGTACSLYTIQDGEYKLCGTETADGAHVHIEVRVADKLIDPLSVIESDG